MARNSKTMDLTGMSAEANELIEGMNGRIERKVYPNEQEANEVLKEFQAEIAELAKEYGITNLIVTAAVEFKESKKFKVPEDAIALPPHTSGTMAASSDPLIYSTIGRHAMARIPSFLEETAEQIMKKSRNKDAAEAVLSLARMILSGVGALAGIPENPTKAKKPKKTT
jgi:hypothetical protein